MFASEQRLAVGDDKNEPTSPKHDPLVGAQVGEYSIEGRLGEGGMGVVYAGQHNVLGKKVAIKVLHPSLGEAKEEVAKLLREARTVAQINHRNIVDVFSFGELADNRPYMVMERLEGIPLDQYALEHKPVPLLSAMAICDGILSGLQAAHSAGVIHRDLKPSNIFVKIEESGELAIKILDFGLAKQFNSQTSVNLSAQMISGTPNYMAPEQVRMTGVTTRTDLYALGFIAYELFVGRHPFPNAAVFEVIAKHLNEEPSPAHFANASVPLPLSRWIASLMAKDPSGRPASALDARRSLRELGNSIQLDGARFLGPATGEKSGEQFARRDSIELQSHAPTVQRAPLSLSQGPRASMPIQPEQTQAVPAPTTSTEEQVASFQPKRWPWVVAAGLLLLTAWAGWRALYAPSPAKIAQVNTEAAPASPTQPLVTDIARANAPVLRQDDVPAAAPSPPSTQVPAPTPVKSDAPERNAAHIAKLRAAELAKNKARLVGLLEQVRARVQQRKQGGSIIDARVDALLLSSEVDLRKSSGLSARELQQIQSRLATVLHLVDR